jgi:hypothetical protein
MEPRARRTWWTGAVIASLCACLMALPATSIGPTYGISAEKPSAGVRIPVPMRLEHEELHAELQRATQAGGRTGQAARAVARLLDTHFRKEEQYALPQLGLLPALAEGRVTPSMRDALRITDRLKAELPQMLAEHKAIVGALQKLVTAARQEKKPQYLRFAEKLRRHAQMEEAVTYPTAVLVGEYLRLKLTR